MSDNGKFSDYGSPNAGDGTAFQEQEIIEGAEEQVRLIKEGAEILNRPLGSQTKLSKEDQLEDWRAKRSNPQATLQEWALRGQAVGNARAALEYSRWAKQMMELENGSAVQS